MVQLNENDEQIVQPDTIKKQLMSHQKTIIKKMLLLEQNDNCKIKIKDKYLLKTTDVILNTNLGILGDKVGAGKTLDVISLISIKPIIKNKPTNYSWEKYVTIQMEEDKIKTNVNLIIVPHKLVPQWKNAFTDSTNLSIYTISTTAQMKNVITKKTVIKKNWIDEHVNVEIEELNQEMLKKYNVILIGNTMFKQFVQYSKNYRWNRIFIDEADTIQLPKDFECYFNFMWLITGTPTGLLNKKRLCYGKLFFEDKININEYIILKNNDDYIDQSIVLPHPNRIKIKCITPRELNIIKDLIPGSILQMINAGNSDLAIKTLNCNVDTSENIMQVITKNLVESITNKKIEIEAEHKKHYHENQKKEHEHKIKIMENNLKKLEEKYDDIRKKIYELNNEYCPVCMSDFTNPVIVKCCNNCFCFDCLAISMGELHNNKCPFCNQLISKSDIHLITNDKTLKNKIDTNCDIKNKLDVLVDIIQKKPNGSIMIFANYMETFSKIEQKLSELNITYRILKGQASAVDRYIDEFKTKKIQILMLNAQYFGAGMNLQMATDLIIYHRFNTEMEEQIIGRAQRMGRTTPLSVYYLIHENEENTIENKFKFNEIENMHYTDWIEQQNNEPVITKNTTQSTRNNVIIHDDGDEEIFYGENDDFYVVE